MRPLTNSEQARVESMLPMVEKLSYWCSQRNRSISRRELEAIGREAVVIATLRHDPQQGELEGFAFAWARGQMLGYVRKTLLMRQRERMFSSWMSMGDGHDDRSTGERFDDLLRSTPESDRREVVDDIAYRASGVFVEMAGYPRSDDGEADHLDWRATALGMEVIEKTETVLGEPERTVFRRIFREEITLDQVATELSVSKRTVQRIVDRVRAAITKAVRASHT